MIYLAGPYTHKNPKIVNMRYQLMSQITHNMMKNGDYVFSPITHGHAIEVEGGSPIDWNVWMVHGLEMLRRCDYLFVVELPGWKESSGVKMEIDIAKINNILTQRIQINALSHMCDKKLLSKYERAIGKESNVSVL